MRRLIFLNLFFGKMINAFGKFACINYDFWHIFFVYLIYLPLYPLLNEESLAVS